MKKKWNIFHMLGLHKYTNCIEFGDYGLGGETKIEYSNPWSLFGVRYTRYVCTECGRKFWMTLGNGSGWEKYYKPYKKQTPEMTEWQSQMHHFIDALASGKTPDEFFKEILK